MLASSKPLEGAFFFFIYSFCFFFSVIEIFTRRFRSVANVLAYERRQREPLRSERVNRWIHSIVRNGKVDLSQGIRNCILSLLLGDDLIFVLRVKVRETNRGRRLISYARICTTDWCPRDRFTGICSTIILSDSLARKAC